MKSIFLTLNLLLFGFTMTWANNVQISNVSIINNGPGTISVKFDLSWDHSWRTNVGPANYDGVWVFFKYKQAGGNWKNIYLTGANNVMPMGFDIYQNTVFNKPGAMIFRDASNQGAGSVTVSNVQLGVVSNLPYDIEVRAFALEMVYVPSAGSRPFWGDGNGTTESTYAFHYSDNTATTSSVVPMLADANSFDDGELETDGIYVYSNDTIQLTNPLGSLDPFPTCKALWCMKYEISQAGYRDFLNTLDSLQQTSRVNVSVISVQGTAAFGSSVALFRNFIEIDTPASLGKPAVFGCDANNNNVYNESSDGEYISCNYLAWIDVAAYLDWSGLAPMSELQYERMCRGTSSAGANPAILGEYAWGDTTLYDTLYTLSNSGAANEVASNASSSKGNALYSTTTNGKIARCGMFATTTSNRRVSGASYYGIMEMSGGVFEYTVTIGGVAGRSCRFIPNGNGEISDLGNAKLTVGGAGFWPGMEGNLSMGVSNTCTGTCEVTGSAGIKLRGGAVSSTGSSLAISDRGEVFIPTARSYDRGGRGVLYIR
ncbi:MAG: hypothetical protein JST27_08155 [Bacteroidetes bacterium]|nr:hypothetical protein [Bacteroidota bacterium]